MQYSHESFNEFIKSFEPTSEYMELKIQILQNTKLGEVLFDTTAVLSLERVDAAIVAGANLEAAIRTAKVAELMDVFCFGFAIGRLYEKKSLQEVQDVFNADNGRGD